MPTESRSTERNVRQQLKELDAVFHALAHRGRRQILLVIHSRNGAMSAGEIARRFSCSWPTTSRHLRVLERAGMVHVERRGRERVYHLHRTRMSRVLKGWLRHFKSTSRVVEAARVP